MAKRKIRWSESNRLTIGEAYVGYIRTEKKGRKIVGYTPIIALRNQVDPPCFDTLEAAKKHLEKHHV